MVDRLTPEQRSRNMRAIRSVSTKPELRVRQLAHSLGYRFRLHRKDLPGKPDLVFPGRGKIVLVNGCFWHGHGCKLGKLPASRPEYWTPKIERNRQRDAENIDKLTKMGWSVLVLWECEIRGPLDILADTLVKFLGPVKSRTTDSHQ